MSDFKVLGKKLPESLFSTCSIEGPLNQFTSLRNKIQGCLEEDTESVALLEYLVGLIIIIEGIRCYVQEAIKKPGKILIILVPEESECKALKIEHVTPYGSKKVCPSLLILKVFLKNPE